MSRISRRGLLQTVGVVALAGGTVGVSTSVGNAAPIGKAAAGNPPPDEDGHELWLRYRLISDQTLLSAYRSAVSYLVVEAAGAMVRSAAEELTSGLRSLLGQAIRTEGSVTGPGAVVLGTLAASPVVARTFQSDKLKSLGDEGFAIRTTGYGPGRVTVIASTGAAGVLYGAFAFLRLLQTGSAIDHLDIAESPANPVRMLDHWDNLDGSVERGYGGQSIFWSNGTCVTTPSRHQAYARAAASIGINAVCVTNVNANRSANKKLLDSARDADLVKLADRLRPYGIRLFISPSFASPMTVGGLPTADPVNHAVRAWWAKTADRLYAAIPDFGGFLIKADSEGEPGPVTYGRTHAQGANMIAAALNNHGGLVFWRAFVYGVGDPDRAKESYELFTPLDGSFASNVIVQIKNGPVDFQVREPIHPLFGAMPHTNLTCELEITQEYTGQSTDLCYLVPQWKTYLDTPVTDDGTRLRDLLSRYRHGGFAGVAGFGDDADWTGHHLAAANAYGFGRLAWDPGLDESVITEEWIRPTFGTDPVVVETITTLLRTSWPTYEDYTSPLGLGMLCNQGDHFYPEPRVRASTTHADAHGVGYDRTRATGSGYSHEYAPGIATIFEEITTTPENLLLFFHHVPYTYRLKSGKTVIQHIYDTHYDGAARVVLYSQAWARLEGHIDQRRFHEVAQKFAGQITHSALWRDSIVGYFNKLSGIADTVKRR
ncbi:alpha-glucuronidase family glycosyl hydrolase [Catenulispora rubra]|uniref:alpha-glucuronidase family glycosyl hydrolase n=1 Tax=Catenulispora rubra TaxID=280293 RepID=UPI0018926157|nr:alpha-glucuronidase family glycosyl hydrolase [Catenulispora rubra]